MDTLTNHPNIIYIYTEMYHGLAWIPVVPHKAVADVSKIGNL